MTLGTATVAGEAGLVAALPTVNAILNGCSAVALACGWLLIKSGRWRAHRAAMITAFVLSCAFLVSYLTYHTLAGVVRYPGHGAARTAYLTILGTHTVLAAFVPVLATITLALGLSGRRRRHVQLARWTLPIWLYVSVTGVVIYWMLFAR